jgi:hypothetical protein
MISQILYSLLRSHLLAFEPGDEKIVRLIYCKRESGVSVRVACIRVESGWWLERSGCLSDITCPNWSTLESTRPGKVEWFRNPNQALFSCGLPFHKYVLSFHMCRVLN